MLQNKLKATVYHLGLRSFDVYL